jgi:Family of unknown function (DUF5681)
VSAGTENSAKNTARRGRGPGNPAKLRPWQPGQPSPNPGGRPKRKPLTDLLIAELETCVHGTEVTRAQDIIRRLVQLASGGDLGAIKYVYDRIEGQPTQKLDVRTEAERMAAEFGLDPDEVEREAWELIRGGKA